MKQKVGIESEKFLEEGRTNKTQRAVPFITKSENFEELMPVKTATHQTIDSSRQISSLQPTVFVSCLVAVFTSLQVTEYPPISDNILCMVKKKH